MIKTTRAQREALKRVYERHDIVPQPDGAPRRMVNKQPLTYREFRATVKPFFGDSCVMVPAFGMWLGIETDGYTHS